MLVELSRIEMELIEEALDLLAIGQAMALEDGPVDPNEPVAVIMEDAKRQAEELRLLRELTIRFQGYLLGLNDI